MFGTYTFARRGPDAVVVSFQGPADERFPDLTMTVKEASAFAAELLSGVEVDDDALYDELDALLADEPPAAALVVEADAHDRKDAENV